MVLGVAVRSLSRDRFVLEFSSGRGRRGVAWEAECSVFGIWHQGM